MTSVEQLTQAIWALIGILAASHRGLVAQAVAAADSLPPAEESDVIEAVEVARALAEMDVLSLPDALAAAGPATEAAPMAEVTVSPAAAEPVAVAVAAPVAAAPDADDWRSAVPAELLERIRGRAAAAPAPAPEIVAEPVAETVAEPVAEIVADPVTEIVVDPVAEIVAEPVAEIVAEIVAEPVAEIVAEPVAEVIPEPATIQMPVYESPITVAAEHPVHVTLPTAYRAPFLPDDQPAIPPTSLEILPEVPARPFRFEPNPAGARLANLIRAHSPAPEKPEPVVPLNVPPVFASLSWDDPDSLLISVRPVLAQAVADQISRLLRNADGLSAVEFRGATGGVAAYEATFSSDRARSEVVESALAEVGGALVSSGDREFYLSIDGR